MTIENIGPFFSGGAILIGACITLSMAKATIRENRNVAKRKATLDHILMREWDKEYLEYYDKFKEIREHPTKGLLYYAENANEEKTKYIKRILNDYELIAVGIKNNILDEDLYKSWERGVFLHNYNKAKPYIDTRRKKLGTQVYKECVDLANKWQNET